MSMNRKAIEKAINEGGIQGKYDVTVDTFNDIADAVQKATEDDLGVLSFFNGDPQLMFHSVLSMKGIRKEDYPEIAQYGKEVAGLEHDFFYSLLGA